MPERIRLSDEELAFIQGQFGGWGDPALPPEGRVCAIAPIATAPDTRLERGSTVTADGDPPVRVSSPSLGEVASLPTLEAAEIDFLLASFYGETALTDCAGEGNAAPQAAVATLEPSLHALSHQRRLPAPFLSYR